jgi:hypothetical protein
MAVKIELKRSAVPGRVPTTSSLELGELAINTYDGKLFYKQDVSGSESIIQVATTSGSILSASYANNAGNANTATSSSYALNSTSASYTLFATSASHALNANNAISASYALNTTSASYALNSTSASYAQTSSFATDFTVTGTLTAQKLVVQTISSSIIYSSGSNIFGDELSDTQTFTGSVNITGSLSINGKDYVNTSASFDTRILNNSSSISLLSGSYLASSASFDTRIINNSSSISILSGSYLNSSASFDIRILNNSSSIDILSSSYLNSSSSFDTRILNNSSSIDLLSGSYLASSASFDTRIINNSSSIGLLSGSYLNSSSSFDTRILNNSSSIDLLSGSYLLSSASFDTRILNNSSSIDALSSSFTTFSSSYTTGSFTGSFKGDGSGLYNISASGIVGLNLSQIASGSVTASIDPNLGFRVNTNTTISGSTLISGSLTVTGSTNLYGTTGTVLSANVDTLIFTGSIYSSGSTILTGDLNVTNGITGSLFGTASWANNATTSSYALVATSASYALIATSASYALDADNAISASHALNADNAITSSYALVATSASYALDATSASYAQTASFANDFTVAGTLTAQKLVVQTISSSVVFLSGSNIFGNDLSNTQTFTGSVNVTGSLTIRGKINSVDSIKFNTSAGVTVGEGELAWNSSDGTLDLGMKGGNVTQQIGEEIFYEIRNGTTSSILNGTSLYANGVTAGSGRITAAPFVADGSVREVRYLGLATENISTGVNGFVTHFGYVRGLDTRGTDPSSIAVGDENWSVGDILYAHPTVAGKLTNVKPKHEIIVAIVIIRNQTSGVLFVRPSSFGHLEDLHDVNINTGSLSTGDLLIYDSGSDYWVNSKQLSGSYGLTGSLQATSFTGSLYGTASWANNSISSSYSNNATSASYALVATSASHALNADNATSSSHALNADNATSASYANNATNALNADNATSASYSLTATSSSYANDATSASYAQTASYADTFIVGGDITGSNALFTGTVTAQKLVVQTVSSSVVYSSGSNVFGNDLSNTQVMTGSVSITGSLSVNNSLVILSNQTSSMSVLSASYANNTTSASYANNSTSASYAENATSSSYALTASFALNGGGGGGGGGAKTFTQLTPSTTWSFTHNLNTLLPLVEVYDSNYHVIIPTNITNSGSAITNIYFENSQSGFAVISTGGSLVITGSNAQLIQTLAATTWSFYHGLNTTYPVFTIFDEYNDVIIPERINVENANTASIYFSIAKTGVAVAANCGLSGSLLFESASYAISSSYSLNTTSASYAETASFVGFNHIQTSSSNIWNITHNLNNQYPMVQVYNSDSTVIMPMSISGSDVNTTIITFSFNTTGYVRII